MMLLRHRMRITSTARIVVIFMATCSVLTSGQICEQDELLDTALKNLDELSQLGTGRVISSLNSVVTTPEDCFSLCCQSHESDGCNVATFTAYEDQSLCILVSCHQPISDCLQTSTVGFSSAIIRLSTDLVTQSPSAIPSIDDVIIDGEGVPLTEQETSGDDQEMPVAGTSTDSTIVDTENIDGETEIGVGEEEQPLVSEGEHVETENQGQPYQQQETYARLGIEEHVDPLANTENPENNFEFTQDLAANNNQGEEPSVVVVAQGGEQQQQSFADNEQQQYSGDAGEEAGSEDLPRDADDVDGIPLNDQEQLAEDSSHPELPASDEEQSVVNDLEQLVLNDEEQSAASDNEQQAYVSNNYGPSPVPVDNFADEDDEEPSVITDGEQPFIASNEETAPATTNNEQQSVNNDDEQIPVSNDEATLSNEEEQSPVSNEEEQSPVSNEEEQPPVSNGEEQPPVSNDEEQPLVSNEDEQPPISNDEEQSVVNNDEQLPVSNEEEQAPVSNEEEQPPVSNYDEALSNNKEQGSEDEQLVVSNEEQSIEQLDGSNNDEGTAAVEETDKEESEDDVALNQDTSVSGHFHANDVKFADSQSRDASVFESFYVAMVTVTIAVMLVVMLIIIVRRIQRARRLRDYKKLAPHHK